MSSGGRGNAFYVDDFEPRTAFGVGHPRGAQVLRALAAAFDTVQVCPMMGLLGADAPDEPLPPNVRAGDRPGADIVRDELAMRAADWQVLWVARPHNLAKIERLYRAQPTLFESVRIVYDAEAIFALREQRKRALAGSPLSPTQQHRALRQELLPAEIAARIVAVSNEECEVIREHVSRPVERLGYGAAFVDGLPPFAARSNLLFVGAVQGIDTPNGDSLLWFTRDVLPRAGTTGLRLTVAGSGTQPGAAAQPLAGPQVQLAGPQDNLAPLYARARVFVAPTRYGSGIPLKVLDAARHGVPVVMTPLLARQLGWRDGVEALVADSAAAFAAAMRRLHDDEGLWNVLRTHALVALRRDYAPADFDATVHRIAVAP